MAAGKVPFRPFVANFAGVTAFTGDVGDDVVPDDDYELRITGLEAFVDNNGIERASVKFTPASGQHAGKALSTTFNYPGGPGDEKGNALNFWKGLLVSAGANEAALGQIQITEDVLKGQIVRAHISNPPAPPGTRAYAKYRFYTPQQWAARPMTAAAGPSVAAIPAPPSFGHVAHATPFGAPPQQAPVFAPPTGNTTGAGGAPNPFAAVAGR